jgi:putative transposase
LEEVGIRVSMDGRGHFFDNIFVEHLWRSVKQENIYLNEYETGAELTTGLESY